MKNFIFLFFALLLASCSDINKVEAPEQTITNLEFRDDESGPKFVITEALVEKFQDDSYKRLLAVNFYSDEVPQVVSFLDEVFVDDGTEGDQVAGDGVFTSVVSYPQSNLDFPCDKYSVDIMLGKSDNFELTDVQLMELGDYMVTTCDGPVTASARMGGGITIKCKIGTCSCGPSCYCIACDLGAPGCWYPYDCEFEISLTW
jgi:hypothetical protein